MIDINGNYADNKKINLIGGKYILTEKQQIKLQKLYQIYSDNKDIVDEINENDLIKILKDNKWNITDSVNALFIFYDKIISGKLRIESLPKNIVRPSDCQGYEETWKKYFNCPNCNTTSLSDSYENFCSDCGIKVDWSEIK